MSINFITVEKTRRLCNNLDESSNIANNLLSSAKSLDKKLSAMKSYNQWAQKMNDPSNSNQSSLIETIQRDYTHFKKIQQENQELRNALEDHQFALELIMSKYRKQVLELIELRNVEQNDNYCDRPQAVADTNHPPLAAAEKKIAEMVSVMKTAIAIDNHKVIDDAATIVKLERENESLRELLYISQQFNGDTILPAPTDISAVKFIDDKKDAI